MTSICEQTNLTCLCGHSMTITYHGCESFYAEDTKCEEVETVDVRSDVCCARGCKDCPGCKVCKTHPTKPLYAQAADAYIEVCETVGTILASAVTSTQRKK